MLEKEFVPYAEALELKELGFNYEVEFYKDSSEEIFDMRTPNDTPCILWQQSFRFFREKGYVSYVEVLNTGKYDYMLISKNFTEVVDFNDGPFDTYGEAELACLRKLIEIIKQQKLNHDLMSGDIVGY